MTNSMGRVMPHSPSPCAPVGKGPSIRNWRQARIGTLVAHSDRLAWMGPDGQIAGVQCP